MRKLLDSPWQTLSIPFALTPIGQLHQSPPARFSVGLPTNLAGTKIGNLVRGSPHPTFGRGSATRAYRTRPDGRRGFVDLSLFSTEFEGMLEATAAAANDELLHSNGSASIGGLTPPVEAPRQVCEMGLAPDCVSVGGDRWRVTLAA